MSSNETYTDLSSSEKINTVEFWLNQSVYKKVVTIVNTNALKFVIYQNPQKYTTNQNPIKTDWLYGRLNDGNKYKVFVSTKTEEYLFKLVIFCTQPHHPNFSYEFTTDTQADFWARILPLKSDIKGLKLPIIVHYNNEMDMAKAQFFVPFLRWLPFMNTNLLAIDELVYFKDDWNADIIKSVCASYKDTIDKYNVENTFYKKYLPYLDQTM